MPHLVLIFLHSESADGSNGIGGVWPKRSGSSWRVRLLQAACDLKPAAPGERVEAQGRSADRHCAALVGRELLGLRAARGESRASGAALSRARGLFHLSAAGARAPARQRPPGGHHARAIPGYAFVSIELQWHAARWCLGVLRLVLDGAQPARVPDKVIADLRKRERNGLIELPPPPDFQRGDCVRIIGAVCRPVRSLCRSAPA